MNSTCQVVRDTEIVSYRMNAVLEYGDNDHYQQALITRDRLRKARAAYDVRAAYNALVYEGREILSNRRSGRPTDSQDPPLSWVILAAFGSRQGGHVYFPPLGLRVRLEPCD